MPLSRRGYSALSLDTGFASYRISFHMPEKSSVHTALDESDTLRIIFAEWHCSTLKTMVVFSTARAAARIVCGSLFEYDI